MAALYQFKMAEKSNYGSYKPRKSKKECVWTNTEMKCLALVLAEEKKTLTLLDSGGSGAPAGSRDWPAGAPELWSQNAPLSMCVNLHA